MQLAVLAEAEVEAPVPAAPPTAPTTVAPGPPSPGRFPTSRDGWLRLAERVVGDWATTLRAALVLVLLFATMVMSIGIAFGPGSAAAATAVGTLVFLAGRRRDNSEPE